MAEGKLLPEVLEEPGMPCIKTVYNWFQQFPDFLQTYAQAKELQAAVIMYRTVKHAREPLIAEVRKVKTETNEKGEVTTSEEITYTDNVARSRLEVDTNKFYLAKVLPKVYGRHMPTAVDPENRTDRIKEFAEAVKPPESEKPDGDGQGENPDDKSE